MRHKIKGHIGGLVILVMTVVTPFTVFADPAKTNITAPPVASTAATSTATSSDAPISDSGTSKTTPETNESNNPTNDSTLKGQVSVDAAANSGTAVVASNKKAGDAHSGEAKSEATIVNVANSNTDFGTGSNFKYFTKNIYDQTSDVTIDPNALLQGGAAGSTNAGDLQTAVSLTDILNNVVLSANSGDATVTNNTIAGSATSGDATALANVINIVGSTISAQNSFLGIVNIYGNLKGNILVPQSFVDSLVTGTANNVRGTNATTIDNNIQTEALSGDATVSGNTTAGNARSGNAATNLTVYNLTGREVVAKNSLLVFVNVLGSWVGMIVQAPGSNTALLGKDASNTSAILPTSESDDGYGSTDTTSHITNNISVGATSGKATVTDNRLAGDATSGRASAGVNLVNITNSNFKLGDWFGALFINVLGSWKGNFGIKSDTPAPSGTTTEATGQGEAGQPIQDVKIFRFDSEAPVTPLDDMDNSDGQNELAGRNRGGAVDLTSSKTDSQSGIVLGASTSKNTPKGPGATTHSVSIDMVALVAMVGALTLLIVLGSLAVRHRIATILTSRA